MPIETGTTIASLDQLWPLSGDFIQDGDNHLRLIKAVLKATFPGAGASGFSVPITATEAELNFSSGVTSNIQAQIDALAAISGVEIPSGTIMLFYQAAAPVGWTQIADDNDSMLRMVSGVGGGVGGVDSPVSLDITHTHSTTGHALTVAEMPVHDHGTATSNISQTTRLQANEIISRERGSGAGIGNTSYEYNLGGNSSKTNIVGITTETGSGDAHSHGDTSELALTFTPKYIDVIQASKD